MIVESCAPLLNDKDIQDTQPRYNLSSLPFDFMQIDKNCIQDAIHRIEKDLHVQNDVNIAYKHLCEILHKEMDLHLPQMKGKQQSLYKRKHTKLKNKPCWSDDLAERWADVCQKEK